MLNNLLNRFRDDDDRQDGAAPAPAPLPFGERMQAKLDETRWQARAHGAHLPIAALPQLGRIEDVLFPLLQHLATHPPSVDEEIAVEAMVTDYLPTTLNAFIGLNREFARTPGRDGRTPGDDLLAQLVTLETAVHDLSRAVYAHDAEELQTQGRFLSTKFSQSDLAL